MTFLRIILAAVVVVAAAPLIAPPAAQAQVFEPRYYPPPRYDPPPQQRRLPGTSENYERRQYVPEQRTQRPRRRGFLERLFGLPERRAPRERQPRRAAPDDGGGGGEADTAAPAKKAVPKTIFVAVLGDSFAQDLAPGLADALSERPEIGLVREIRPGVGFLKETEKTWRMVVDEVLERDPPVSAAVVFMGPTDDPPVKKKKKKAEEAEPQGPAPALTASPWMDRYAAKVDDIALAFRQKNIPLIWVGLPPVEDEETTGDHLFLNDLVRQRVAALGGTFVDVWEGFVDAEEKYTAQGPNIEGRTVRLRTADGVHFTRAGARKIGHSVELELRAYLAPKDPGDGVAEFASFDSTAPTTPGSSRILLLGQAPRAPGALLATNGGTDTADDGKTEAGQTAQAGELAGAEGEKAPAVPPPPEPKEEALRTGEAVPPKPGRADDFAWPEESAN